MKATSISIIIAILIIVGALLVAGGGDSGTSSEIVDNVSVVDGKQIIAIDAKGGYSPRTTLAAAGMPTVIRVNTQSTFDCSAAISIPSLGYRKNLPPSGVTEIEVPPQQAGTKLQGLCAMGMYGFVVNFE